MASSGELAGILTAAFAVTLTAVFAVLGYYFRRLDRKIDSMWTFVHSLDTRVTVGETKLEALPQAERRITSGAEIMAGLTTEVSNHLRWHERHDTRGP